MAGLTKAEYVELGKDRIMDALRVESAMVHAEVEARIAENRRYSQAIEVIQPHILTEALRELGAAGHIDFSRSATTNSAEIITTIQPSNTHKIKTKVERAAASKRKLYGRYRSWNRHTQRYEKGRIGPAGERALRNSLLQAHIITPIAEDAGEVTEVLNHKVNGALDSAGFYTPVLKGFPQPPVTLLIEVKNVRSWIYPSSGELYQLLSKACGVQHAAQEYGVLPVLVCRQAHPRTLWMGKDLGFFVVETGRQFVEKVSEDDVAEIRQALAFKDLIVVSPDYTSERIADRLTKVLPKIAVEFAERWKVTTKLLRTEIIDVHRSRNDAKKRFRAFMDLGAAAEGVGLRERDWYV